MTSVVGKQSVVWTGLSSRCSQGPTTPLKLSWQIGRTWGRCRAVAWWGLHQRVWLVGQTSGFMANFCVHIGVSPFLQVVVVHRVLICNRTRRNSVLLLRKKGICFMWTERIFVHRDCLWRIMDKCLRGSTFTPSARTWWLCSVFPFFGNPVHIHYLVLFRTGWVHLMLGITQWTIPQRLPDSLCTLAYCYISVAQGMIVIVPCRANTPHKTYGRIRPGTNYHMHLPLLFTTLAFSRSFAAADQMTVKNPLQTLTEENADALSHSASMDGYTAVYSPMFQLIYICIYGF